MPEKPPTPTEAPAREAAPPAGTTLRGTPVAPGLVLGPVHRKDYDLLETPPQRVPLDQVERELNRFHKSLFESRRQLEDLKGRFQGKVPSDHVRILDTHLALLKDSVFLSDVENLIIHEQMTLEASIGKVIADFDRIFRLVQNEALRERAVDLRDVGIRVLRNIEKVAGEDR
jgi:phosphoenolpyruvate-protein kinase (PTS system EI component)